MLGWCYISKSLRGGISWVWIIFWGLRGDNVCHLCIIKNEWTGTSGRSRNQGLEAQCLVSLPKELANLYGKFRCKCTIHLVFWEELQPIEKEGAGTSKMEVWFRWVALFANRWENQVALGVGDHVAKLIPVCLKTAKIWWYSKSPYKGGSLL